MIKVLRRVPTPLLVALLGAIALGVHGVVRGLTIDLDFDGRVPDRRDGTLDTLIAGSWFAISVLELVGLGWLVRRTSGTARTGVRIAFFAAASALAIMLLSICTSAYLVIVGADLFSSAWKVEALARSIAALLLAVGLGIATRRWYWLVGGSIVAVVTNPPWFIAEAMFARFASGLRASIVLQNGLLLASALATFALVACACRDATEDGERPRLAPALRRIELSLYGYALATVPLAVLLVWLWSARAGGGVVTGSQIVVLLATGIELACLVVFGLGTLALARGRSELPAWLLIASSTAALCIGGTMLSRLLQLIQQYFERPRASGSFISFFGPHTPALTPATAALVLWTFAVGGVLVAVAIAARRSGREDVRARTMIRTGTFVALALAAITALKLIAAVGELTPLDVMILFAGNTALVASSLVAAGCMRLAAKSLEAAAELPVATLVKASP